MDPTVTNQLNAAIALQVQRESTAAGDRVGRQSDGAAFDMRALGAAIAREVAMAPDASSFADLQTSSHVPNSAPFIAPPYVQPTGKPVGS